MIEIRRGDLLQQDDVNIICHQANCFCTMGAGIAGQIARSYPYVKSADAKTAFGDQAKMGTWSDAAINESQRILNMYTQYRPGQGSTSLVAINTAFDHLGNLISQTTDDKKDVIGIPWKYGCGIAGGDWDEVLDIFLDLFGDHGVYSSIRLVICKI